MTKTSPSNFTSPPQAVSGGTVQGTPTRQGARFFPPFPADHDSYLTTRFKQAGLVAFGKTNVPEFGLVPTTEGKLYGPAHNPWNLAHSTGGSSGGSAAAVAARLLPAATGTDTGGSIRQPASFTGVTAVTFKLPRAVVYRTMLVIYASVPAVNPK